VDAAQTPPIRPSRPRHRWPQSLATTTAAATAAALTLSRIEADSGPRPGLVDTEPHPLT